MAQSYLDTTVVMSQCCGVSYDKRFLCEISVYPVLALDLWSNSEFLCSFKNALRALHAVNAQILLQQPFEERWHSSGRSTLGQLFQEYAEPQNPSG